MNPAMSSSVLKPLGICILAFLLALPRPMNASTHSDEEERVAYNVVIGALLVFIAYDLVKDLLPQDSTVTFPEKEQAEMELYYLASGKEMKALEKLETAAEVQAFTDAFWLKFDPNPMTAENEFRIQYLDRLTYVNRAYGSSLKQGWRTDRGRVLLKYGMPNEVREVEYIDFESRFGPYTERFDFEVWIYPFSSTSYRFDTIFDDPTYFNETAIFKRIGDHSVFVFADLTAGMMQQIYSSVENEYVDPKVMKNYSTWQDRGVYMNVLPPDDSEEDNK